MSQGIHDPLLDRTTVRWVQRLGPLAIDAALAGATGERSRLAGRGGPEFQHHRRYIHGDDLRRVDWPAYGRTRELVVRIGPALGHATVDVLVDVSRSMAAGSPQQSLHTRRIAAVLGAAALVHSDCARAWALADGLALAGARRCGVAGLDPFEFDLRRLTLGQHTDLASSLLSYGRQAEAGDLGILITDGLVEASEFARALATFTRTVPSTLLIHAHPPLATFARGPVTLRDAESGERLSVLITPQLLATYRRRVADDQDRIRRVCEAAGTPYVHAPLGRSPVDVLAAVATAVAASGKFRI